jgi:hypothetical protein
VKKLIEVINSDEVPQELWRQFTVSDLEDEIRARFFMLYDREPEHIYEVHYGSQVHILAGPVKFEERKQKKE